MPKLKKKINYSILIKKIKKTNKKNYFLSNKKIYFLLIKMNFFYSNFVFPEEHILFLMNSEEHIHVLYVLLRRWFIFLPNTKNTNSNLNINIRSQTQRTQ